MKNPAIRLYCFVFLAVVANAVVMGMVLGITVVNEIQLINHMELGS